MDKEVFIRKSIEQRIGEEDFAILTLNEQNQVKHAATKLREIFLDVFNMACDVLKIPRLKVDVLANNNYKHSVFYDKNRSRVIVLTKRFLETCRVYEKCLGLDFLDMLTYTTLHEIGHHQLNLIRVVPIENVESFRYYVVYSIFEDYVVSQYFRGQMYRELEREIVRFEAIKACRDLDIKMLRDKNVWGMSHIIRGFVAKWIDKIGLIGLAVALNYIDYEDLDISDRIKDLIWLIVENMREITRERIKETPRIAYNAWLGYMVRL